MGLPAFPKSIYWAIVTMTTVGFGDITPQTVPGQMLASVLMIMGYGVLAVPTGIVSVEIARAGAKEGEITTRACESCHKQGHDLSGTVLQVLWPRAEISTRINHIFWPLLSV